MILVGLPACSREIAGRLEHATPARYAAAVLGGVGGVPVMIPPAGHAVLPLLDRIDGLLLPGSRSNVDPAAYGAPDETPDQHDPARDGTVFPLLREALRRRIPVLAICRGIQELNVALGGTLHQRVHALPGRHYHRGPSEIPERRYAPAHTVRLTGRLAAMLGAAAIEVNSVHGQAIDRLAPGLLAEATAPDGTIEAVRRDGEGWCYGVQWHPEWDYAAHADRRALFAAFGDACRAYAAAPGRLAA